MIPKVSANGVDLARLLKPGEGPTLEFKRSTGELREGLQTLCAFLNGSGGIVLFGVRPDGRPEGQQVTDQTLRDIAEALDRFEPPVSVPIERLPLDKGREIVVLRVEGTSDSVPFTFEGRPYVRVGSITRKMPQEKYEKLLLERGHAKRRWENQPAEGLRLKDLDRKEILRTRELAIEQGRIPSDTSREILINAVMHRDYSDYGGHVAIVVFDDRIEIRSYGRLPSGVTLEQLSGQHLSKLRNPLVAETFHRTGAIEAWGRGTNRVIDLCRKHGVAAPVFEERQGFVIVTFKAPIVPELGSEKARDGIGENTRERGSEKGSEKSSEKILRWIGEDPDISAREMAKRLKLTSRAVEKQIGLLKERGLLRRIGPDKGGHWEVVK